MPSAKELQKQIDAAIAAEDAARKPSAPKDEVLHMGGMVEPPATPKEVAARMARASVADVPLVKPTTPSTAIRDEKGRRIGLDVPLSVKGEKARQAPVSEPPKFAQPQRQDREHPDDGAEVDLRIQRPGLVGHEPRKLVVGRSANALLRVADDLESAAGGNRGRQIVERRLHVPQVARRGEHLPRRSLGHGG